MSIFARWYLDHLESLDGVESGIHIVFKSKRREGEDIALDSYAADRCDSSKGCDDVGQIWIRDVEGYSKFMNDLSPAEREAEISMLIQHHTKVAIADAVLKTLGMGDPDAQDVLNAYII